MNSGSCLGSPDSPRTAAGALEQLRREAAVESGQTLEGSFAAVSTLLIATKDAFFSTFFETYKICALLHLFFRRWAPNLEIK